MRIPGYIKTAALSRARESKEARARALQLARTGRRRDVEPDEDRKIRSVARRVGVGEHTAAAILGGADIAALGLDSERAMIATAVAGGTDDILPISFLERARRAADAVGHLTQVNGTSMGTCLMVSPRLLMTNNHVIKTPEIAKRRRVHFNFEKDAAGTALPVSSFKLDPETFWLTDPSAELDFTVVALGEPVNAGATQPAFRRLSGRNDKHALGDFVNIIQHPNGHPKRIVLRENMLVHRAGTDPAAEPVLLYTADTDESSSGAPVFNDFWDLVALHHASVKAGNITICGETRLDVVNEGGRASFIIAALNAARHTLSDEQRELLDDALAE